jgi:hypothetical protein
MKIVVEATLEQIAANQQKISEDQEADENESIVREWVTNTMLGNLLLDYHFVSSKKAMKAVLHLHYKPELILFSCN